MTAARVMILDDVPVDRPVHETLRRVLRARLADAYFRPLPSVIVDVGLDSTKVASWFIKTLRDLIAKPYVTALACPERIVRFAGTAVCVIAKLL